MNPEPSTRATRILTELLYPWAGAVTSTITQYLYAGDRSRTASLDLLETGFEIERRDLRQRFRVFASEKKYQTIPLLDLATEQEKTEFRYSGRHWRKRVICQTQEASRELKISVIYEPTGEEQPMFGCVARRWIVRRRDEHDRKFGENWTEAITDAWYLDTRQLSARFAGFSGDLVHHAFCYAKSGDEREVISHSGERPSGLCASSETKSLQHSELPGGEVREYRETSSVQIINIVEVSVPLTVFELPKGFRKIPVYPSRFTVARLNLSRQLKHLFRVST